MQSYSLLNEWGIDNKENNIIISGDGHNFVVLDYSTDRNNPTIAYIDTQINKVYKMFSTFEELLQNLYEDPAEINIPQYHNKTVEDFFVNPSLEQAKTFVNSADEDAIYTGFEYWEQTKEDLTELYETLLQHIEFSNYLSVQELAVRILWQKIMTNQIKDRFFIQKIINTIPDSPLQTIQEYKMQIVDLFNDLS